MFVCGNPGKKVISLMVVLLICVSILSVMPVLNVSAATTAVITNTNPTVKSCIQANNLIPNADLENGTGFWSGWYGYGWGSPWPAITSSDSHSGSNSLLLGAESWNPSGNSATVSIEANSEYTFSFWYKGADNGGANFIYQLHFPDYANRIVQDNSLTVDSQWRQVAVSFNSGNATSFSMLLWLHDNGLKSYLLIDDMCLFKTPPYVAPQMINGTLENVTSGSNNNIFPAYSDLYWSTAFNGTNIHTEISTADTHSTSGKSVKYTNWSWNPNSITAVKIEPNTDYTFSVWTKSIDDGSNSLSALLAYVGSTLIQDAGNGISWYMTRLDGLWHQYAVSFNSGHETTFSITLTGDYKGGTNYCVLDDFFLFKNSDGLPPITFNTFNVSNNESKTVTNVQPNTTVANFTATGKTTIAKNGAAIEIKNFTGTTLGQLDKIGTGTTVDVYVCEIKVSTYNILIYGDVDGDGLIGIGDLVSLKLHLLNKVILTDINKMAGNVTKNGTISISDLLAVKKAIVGIGTINQNS